VESAIVAMRAAVAAEGKFAEAHPDLGYTCTLLELPADELIEGLLKNPRRNGYTFEIRGCRTARVQGANPTYQVTARPAYADMPAFCSDDSGVLRFDPSGSVSKCLEAGTPW